MFTKKELKVKMKDGSHFTFEINKKNNETYKGWNLYHAGSFAGNFKSLDEVDDRIAKIVKSYNE